MNEQDRKLMLGLARQITEMKTSLDNSYVEINNLASELKPILVKFAVKALTIDRVI